MSTLTTLSGKDEDPDVTRVIEEVHLLIKGQHKLDIASLPAPARDDAIAFIKNASENEHAEQIAEQLYAKLQANGSAT